MAKLNLSLTDVKIQTGGSSDYSIVPTGKYNVVVGKTEIKDTKNGSALIIGYEVIDGEHKGSLIKDFLNVSNPSQEAVRISNERIATVAWSTNAPLKNGVLEDSDDLVGKEPFTIAVEQVDDGEYKNMKIKAVLCTRDLTAAPKAVESKKTSKPWEKK